MSGRKENNFRKKNTLWLIGFALGIAFLSCKSPTPKPAAPIPPRFEPGSVSQEISSIPPEPGSTPQEAVPTPPPEPVLALVKPAPAIPPVIEPKPKENFFTHTVRWNGETLSIIAAWYTGDAGRWRDITKANLNIDPKLIYEGEKILIPETLLKTREKMPQYFVDRFYAKARKEKPGAKPQPAMGPEEEPKLIGPKKFRQK